MSAMRSQSGAVDGKYTITSRDGINAVQGVINEIEAQRKEAVRMRNPDSARIYTALLGALRAVSASGATGITLTDINARVGKTQGGLPFSRNQVGEVMRLVYAYMAPIQAKEFGQSRTAQPARPTQRHSSARQRLDHGKLK